MDPEKAGGQNESGGNLDLENFLEGQILELEGELDVSALKASVVSILDRHEVLRSERGVNADGLGGQYIVGSAGELVGSVVSVEEADVGLGQGLELEIHNC